MRILLLLAALLIPQLAHAAYLDQAEVLRYEQEKNGSARLIMRFQGNSGEPIVDRPYPVIGGSTVPKLRAWISQVVADLNLARLAGTAPQVAPGTILTGLAPSPVPPSAKRVWRNKVAYYREICTIALGGNVLTACNTIKSDIETTYQPGFLDE